MLKIQGLSLCHSKPFNTPITKAWNTKCRLLVTFCVHLIWTAVDMALPLISAKTIVYFFEKCFSFFFHDITNLASNKRSVILHFTWINQGRCTYYIRNSMLGIGWLQKVLRPFNRTYSRQIHSFISRPPHPDLKRGVITVFFPFTRESLCSYTEV